MKIIDTIRKRNRRHAIKFDEQYDWFSDETPVGIRDYQSDQQNDFEMVNWEANEEKLPVIEVDEADETAGGYLVDDFAGTEEIPIEQGPVEQEPLVQKRDDFMEETGEIGEVDEVDESVAEATEIDEKVPDFASTQDAVNAAIEENRVMEIFYVTKGRGSRNEDRYLKRERGLPKEEGGGVNIHRIIEPHYIYTAGNGNTIVVTYDRSVRRIRAFIIDNIYDYNFTRNRKTKEDQYFRPRMRVMPSSGKGIKTMKNVNDKLTKIASALESKGLKKSSLVVRDAIKAAANYKMAQYVGVQGYWLKNRRCWDNCYRHKRTAEPGTPAQEVWMECWSEYNDSINNDSSPWGKYANKEDVIKISGKEEKEWNKMFVESVDKRVKEGMKRPVAIYDVIDSEAQKYAAKIIEASSDLMTLADAFSKNGQKEIGEQMEEVAIEMLKEAQFQGTNPNFFSRMKQKAKDWFGGKGKKEDVIRKIQDVISRANDLMAKLNLAPTASMQKGLLIEAGKGTRIVEAKPGVPWWKEEKFRGSDAARNDPAFQQELLEEDRAFDAEQQATGANQSYEAADEAQKVQDAKRLDNQQTGQQQQRLGGEWTKSYNSFVTDINQLTKEFYGLQQMSKDPEVSRYTSTAIPLLQGFVGKSTEQRNIQTQSERREFLRGSLQKLITGLQGIANGQLPTAINQPGGLPPAGPPTGPPIGPSTGPPTGGTTKSPAGPSQSTASAKDIAYSCLQSDGGKALAQNVSGDKMTKTDMAWVVKAFEDHNLPFTTANWNEFIMRLGSPI